MSKKKSPHRNPSLAPADATDRSGEFPSPQSKVRHTGATSVIVGQTPATARRLAILRLPAVMARTGLARSTVYAQIASGTFPESISLGSPNAVGWLESEVEEWILARVRAERGADWGRGIYGVSDDSSSSAA